MTNMTIDPGRSDRVDMDEGRPVPLFCKLCKWLESEAIVLFDKLIQRSELGLEEEEAEDPVLLMLTYTNTVLGKL